MKRVIYNLVIWMSLLLPAGLSAAPPAVLPGTLTLTSRGDAGAGNEAWDFTYTESGWATVLTGVLIKPLGAGPYPAIVATHGKGGNAAGFGMEKGKSWFAPAGYLTIAPELTHAGNVYCNDATNACGGSSENVRRARRANDILISQNLVDLLGAVVDRRNIFLYGNSLGALTTIELAEDMGAGVRAVAISAGGIVGRRNLAYMTPSGSEGVSDIYAPVLQMHGNIDNVIYPNEAQAFADALEAGDKVYQQVWFPDSGHNIARGIQTTNQVRDFILAWFDTYLNRTEPVINMLSPSAATVGAMISIEGDNFGVNTNANSLVKLSGQVVTPSFWSAQLIELMVPTGAASGAVEVVVPVGPITDPLITKPVTGGVRSNRITFTVLP